MKENLNQNLMPVNIPYFRLLKLGKIIEVDGLVSPKNRPLYDDITSHYKNIEFRESADYCRTHFNKEYPKVYIGLTNNAGEEALTHELLHMKLYSLGFSSDYDECINGITGVTDILIGGKKLVEEIANNIAHSKMLPLFKQLGYDEGKFYSYLFTRDFTFTIPEQACKVSDSGFGQYVTGYISAFVNLKYTRTTENSHQYDVKSLALNMLSTELYELLEQSFSNWELDLKDYNSIRWFNGLFKSLNIWYYRQTGFSSSPAY